MASNTGKEFGSFTPPGAVSVSRSALELAQVFAADANRDRLGRDWIVTFDWADSRAVRPRLADGSLGQWEELGGGLDLAAFERDQVPPDAVQTAAGIEFAVRIPVHVYEKSVRRLIDRDDSAISKLTLR